MKLFLTIDVECYSGDYEREVYAGGLGIEYIIDVLRTKGIKAVFFVEALGATSWGLDPVRRICDLILRDGHEVQLHIHPVTANMPGFQDHDDLFCAHDTATQSRLIAEGTRILRECGTPEPLAFRAGDLAADVNTLKAMRENGIVLGFNRDLDVKSSIRTRLNDAFPVVNDISCLHGVTDVPVSCIRSPIPFLDGQYRHLQITALSSRELKYALNAMLANAYKSAALLTHPGEFFRYAGGKPRPIVENRRRLEFLAGFLGERSDMQPALCRDLIDQPALIGACAPPRVKGSLLHIPFRLMQQALKRLGV